MREGYLFVLLGGGVRREELLAFLDFFLSKIKYPREKHVRRRGRKNERLLSRCVIIGMPSVLNGAADIDQARASHLKHCRFFPAHSFACDVCVRITQYHLFLISA